MTPAIERLVKTSAGAKQDYDKIVDWFKARQQFPGLEMNKRRIRHLEMFLLEKHSHAKVGRL